jgi:O-antigen/teichoic acid export membrane protein
LRFDRYYLFNVYPKIASFIVTVVLAILIRNYWALVAGILSGQLASNVLGYIMQPYRPRFSVAKVREIWSFSIWSLIRNIGSYLNGQVDLIAVGGISSAASLGRYSVADDLASSPINELNGPLIAALYPVLAKIQHLPDKSRELYLRAVAWSAIVCCSASVGVALVAPDLVYVVLGKKWLDTIPLLGWLAVGAGILGLSSGAYGTLDAFGLPHVGARMQWVRLIFLALAIVPVALIWRDAESIAIARAFVAAVFIPTLFISVGRVLGVPLKQYFSALWRPFAAAATMALGVSMLNLFVHGPPIERLAIDVLAGAALYVGAIMCFWYLSSKPSSPEQDVHTYLGLAFGSMRTRFQR